MSSAGSLVGSTGHLDMAEIFQLLESTSLSVIDETVELVRDNLGSTPDSWLLNSLVDFYIQSGNGHARDLLCMVRQHQHKALMVKIDEHLQKISSRLKALNLLNHIIRNESTWTHHILTSRTFQSVLKCLQVDTDLPTITSALYVVATIMPKVATELSSYLPTICGIYIRLVSWHTIKPVGASEINLIHVHAAVYALFLCLYGMFPCYFMKYLQQYFQVGSSTKGSGVNDKEKIRVFENSVSPMLDQVRLHPGLIVESSTTESSTERWRKLESQDIIADISKLALDVTENPAVSASAERKMSSVSDANDVSIQMISNVCSKMGAKSSRAGSEAESTIATTDHPMESIWSPSIAIGLSTPPHSRAMSPAPGTTMDSTQLAAKLEASQKSHTEKTVDDTSAISKSRPLSLNMAAVDAFVPNRPLQTASASSTPLKHFVPSFLLSSSQSLSNSQTSSPQREMKRKRSGHKIGEELERYDDVNMTVVVSDGKLTGAQDATEVDLESSTLQNENQDNITEPCEGTPPAHADAPRDAIKEPNDEFISIASKDIDFTPGLQPNPNNPTLAPVKNQEVISEQVEQVIPTQKLLELKNQSKYIEKSPNELLDLHISLLAEAYDKYKDKFPVTSNKDIEWQVGETSGAQPTPEVMYLRSQVLQMHCAMLYERHRREQHALRARKLMRKAYDTTALEERVKTMTCQLAMKSNEIEDYRTTVKSYQNKLRLQEENYKAQLESVRMEGTRMKEENKELEMKYKELEQEKNSLWDECEALKNESSTTSSKLFELEQKFKTEQACKGMVAAMEAKIRELQVCLLESREANVVLQEQVQSSQGECKARHYESQLVIETYKKELAELRAKHLCDQKSLDSARVALKHTESNLQRERSIVSQQKNYLENVKSLARGQIKAMEAKYNAQKHISQRLEIQVMELFSRLSAIEGEMSDGERTRLTSGPRSIKTLSAVQSDSHYQRIYSSSPQLSPPIHGGLLAERALTRHPIKTADHVTTPANSKHETSN